MKATKQLRKPSVRRAPARRSPWIPFALGVVISLPFHALLIALLAGWSIPTGSIGNAPEATEMVIALAPLPRVDSPQPVAAVASETTPFVDAASSDASASPSLALADDGGGESLRPAGLSAGSGGGSGGTGASVQFFGSAGKGRRIGFAVDCSGSMLAGGRLRRAQEELIRSIEGLPDYVSVCVAFFNDGCVTAPAPAVPGAVDIRGYAKVRPGMIAALRHWMQQVPAKGGTRPARAIRYLFDQGDPPDVIFLLSDGEIESEEVESILSVDKNRGPAPVHTVLFNLSGNDGGESLRHVANETGGTFSRTRPEVAP